MQGQKKSRLPVGHGRGLLKRDCTAEEMETARCVLSMLAIRVRERRDALEAQRDERNVLHEPALSESFGLIGTDSAADELAEMLTDPEEAE